jgi:hypothetical protein
MINLIFKLTFNIFNNNCLFVARNTSTKIIKSIIYIYCHLATKCHHVYITDEGFIILQLMVKTVFGKITTSI